MNLFKLKPSELMQLTNQNPSGAVDFFRLLLTADASLSGLPLSEIDIPSAIYDPDGGVDGEFRISNKESNLGLIKPGRTVYQIKCGPIRRHNKSEIKELFCTKARKPTLKPRIKSCFDNKDTFYLILFGYDHPDPNDDGVVKRINDYLKGKYLISDDKKIEIFRANTLTTLFNQFPALVLQLRDIITDVWHINFWQKTDQMSKKFVGSETSVENAIRQIRDAMRSEEHYPIRIIGSPGIGKTRIVLESLLSPEFEPFVLYLEHAGRYENIRSTLRLTSGDLNEFIILVVDECDNAQYSNILSQVSQYSDKIRLITITNEFSVSSGKTRLIEIGKLSDENISKIIINYGIDEYEAKRWARYLDGYPRYAHLIGQNLNSNPSDPLQEIDTESVWNRAIAGTEDPKSEIIIKRARILGYLSLFRKFGYLDRHKEEVDAIKNIIRLNHYCLEDLKLES